MDTTTNTPVSGARGVSKRLWNSHYKLKQIINILLITNFKR